jgi:hypothetical protein
MGLVTRRGNSVAALATMLDIPVSCCLHLLMLRCLYCFNNGIYNAMITEEGF